MTIEQLIARFHAFAQASAQPSPSFEDGQKLVADALFTVAVAHKLRADGPAAVIEEAQRLIELCEPMAATSVAVELIGADPSLLRKLPN